MADHTITIQNFQFNAPSGDPIVIAVGDSVKWVNRDDVRHDARRDAAPTFRTRLLSKDETSDAVTFSEATGAEGIEYFCTPHSSFMKGRIIVTLRGTQMTAYSGQENQRQEAIKAHRDHAARKP
ncbi:hypothetical protein AYO47_01840 [Planctomyces sp. SCGC AG-212-M04]|nr:hypothetical protein AYO47_01840 [Planctomyces sp. SCGC AG-212-M04]